VTESDLLLTLAEIAVAFAGFASLVSILGERQSVDHALVLSARMRAMLLSALLVTGFAVLPPAINAYAADPGTTWAIAYPLLLIGAGAYLAWLWVTLHSLQRARDFSNRPFQTFVILPVLLLTSLAIASLAIFNLVLRRPGLYLTVLLLILFQGAFAFALIVFSFLPQLPPSGK
jgi:hypothetical protein